jgi:hypothetical protein
LLRLELRRRIRKVLVLWELLELRHPALEGLQLLALLLSRLSLLLEGLHMGLQVKAVHFLELHQQLVETLLLVA